MLFKIKVDYVQPSFGVRKIKKKIVKKRLQNVSMTLWGNKACVTRVAESAYKKAEKIQEKKQTR